MGNDGEDIVILIGVFLGILIGILLFNACRRNKQNNKQNQNSEISNLEISINKFELSYNSRIIDIEKTDSTYIYTIEVKR